MKTTHTIYCEDSTQISFPKHEIVVTSPPYPMVEMWDSVFAQMNQNIKNAYGYNKFELMHQELDKVWKNISDSIVEGGIVCINIGDATRTSNDRFKLYPNHSRIIKKMIDLGFDVLPEIIWKKTSNKPNKFMGSGMKPPNAYVTQEHEYILIFRKGKRRNPTKRDKSAYFSTERNKWFSDIWEVSAASQSGSSRDVSAEYPLEIPYRLINMFSSYGDTVLDPFWGTGTTTIASMISARNSCGIEIDQEFVDTFTPNRIKELSNQKVRERIELHKSHVSEGNYKTKHGIEVHSKDEKDVEFYTVDNVVLNQHGYTIKHKEFMDNVSIQQTFDVF